MASTRSLWVILRARDEASRTINAFSSNIRSAALAAQAATASTQAAQLRNRAAQLQSNSTLANQIRLSAEHVNLLDRQASQLRLSAQQAKLYRNSMIGSVPPTVINAMNRHIAGLEQQARTISATAGVHRTNGQQMRLELSRQVAQVNRTALAYEQQAKQLRVAAQEASNHERRLGTLRTRMAEVGQSATALAVAFGAVGIGGMIFMKNAIDTTIDYQKQVALTHTQIDGFKASLEDVAKIGLSVARSIAVPFEEIQPALFEIFSSTEANIEEASSLIQAFAKGAVAGNSSIEASSRGTIAILNAFNIPFKNINQVMDVQFELIRKGVLTYDEFAATIGRAIPPATRAGQTFETVAGMLAFMTRNGLSAAMASTSSARAMEAMSHPRSIEFMENLGIKIRDANGDMLPFTQSLQNLRDHLLSLPKPDRVEALVNIFRGAGGTIQARRFLEQVLLEPGGLEEFQGFVKNMEEASGVFEEKYAEMADTVAAKTQLLANRWTALKEGAGQVLLPFFIAIVTGLSNMVEWFNKLDPGVRRTIVIFIAVATVVSLAAAFFFALVAVIAIVVTAFATAGSAIAMVMGVLLGVAAVLALVGAAFIAAWKSSENFRAIIGNIVNVLTKLWDIARETASGVASAFREHLLPPLQELWQIIESKVLPRLLDLQKMFIDEVIPKIREAGRIIKSIFAKAFEILGAAIEKFAVPALKKASEWWERNQEKLRPLIKWLGQMVKWTLIVAAVLIGVLVAAFLAPIVAVGLLIAAIGLIIFILGKVWEFIKFIGGKIGEFFVFLGHAIGDIWGNIATFLSGVWDGIVGKFRAFISNLKSVVAGIGIFFAGVWAVIVARFQAALDLVISILSAAGSFLLGIWQRFWDTFGGIATGVWDVFMATWLLFVTLFKEIWKDWLIPLGQFFANVWLGITTLASGAWAHLVSMFNQSLEFIKNVWNTAWTTVSETFANAWLAIRTLALGAWNHLVQMFNQVLETIKTSWNVVWATISGFAQMIWNQILERIRGPLNTAKNTISSVLETIKGLWRTAWTFVSTFVRDRLNAAKETITNAISTIKGFFANAGRWLWDAGRNIIQGLIGGIESMLGGLTGVLDAITRMIPDEKGPKEKDLRLLRPTGKFLMQGLMAGIAEQVPALASQLRGISTTIGAQTSVSPFTTNSLPVGIVRSAEQPSTTINQEITVNTQEIDPVRHATELGWMLSVGRS